MNKSLSIVVPVYNSVQSLTGLVQRIARTLKPMGVEYEIIFVNDASPNPKTWPHLRRLVADNPRVRAINLMRNFGQQAATLCGIEVAKGDYVLTMDDDLQHRPEDIPLLWVKRGHDIVIGQFPVKRHTLFKRITSRIKGWLDHILIGKPSHIQMSSFRLMSRAVVDGMKQIYTPYPFIPALMFYVSKDVVGVEVTHAPRSEGRSTYTLTKLIGVFANLVINNSSILLRITGGMGLVFACLSFIFGIYLLLRKLWVGVSVPGWTSTMLVSIFGIGMILFSLGVIGEYLLRLVVTSEHKPVYVIRERLEGAASLGTSVP